MVSVGQQVPPCAADSDESPTGRSGKRKRELAQGGDAMDTSADGATADAEAAAAEPGPAAPTANGSAEPQGACVIPQLWAAVLQRHMDVLAPSLLAWASKSKRADSSPGVSGSSR